MKRLSLELDDELHRLVKLKATTEGKSIKDWATMVFEYYVRPSNPS